MDAETAERPLWRRWQSVVAVLLFFLNVDYVVMPTLQSVWKIAGWPLFWWAAIFATGELIYWNEYAKWVVRHAQRSQHVRTASTAFRDDGLLGEFNELFGGVRQFGADAWDWFVEHARSQAEANSPAKQRMLQGVLGVIKNTHIWMAYPMMLGLGMLPVGWAIGIIVQRVVQAPGAFIVLLAANAVKTYLLGLLYLLLPLWAKALILLAIVSVVLWQIRRLTRKAAAPPPAP